MENDSWLGFCMHDRLVAWVEKNEHTTKWANQWAKEGLEITIGSVEYARKHLMICPDCHTKKTDNNPYGKVTK